MRRLYALLTALVAALVTGQAAAQDSLFASTYLPATIEQAPLGGFPAVPIITFAAGERASALAYDGLNSKIYWIDEIGNRIRRSDGLTIETVIAVGDLPGSLAIDPVFQKLYWTDSSAHAVKRANLDGTGIVTLLSAGLTSPAGIAIDVAQGRLFVSDDEGNLIVAANLDGSSPTTIHSAATGLDTPVGLAVDTANHKLYWTQASSRAPVVRRSNYDGTGVETVATNAGNGLPWAIAYDPVNRYIYWSDLVVGTVQRTTAAVAGSVQTIRTGTRLDYSGIALGLSCSPSGTDSDGDGAADCLDECPANRTKSQAGFCGCDLPDSDVDGDGVLDCVDGCPVDPGKFVPLFCGCGVPDTDTDFDAIPDCLDLCPDDFFKTEPGLCGCNGYEFPGDSGGTTCLQFPVLEPDTELVLPPEIFINDLRNFVVLTLQRFSRVDDDFLNGSSAFATEGTLTPRAAAKTKLSLQYRVVVQQTKGGRSKTVARIVSKRNQVTVRKLKPGSYNASYSVEAVRGKKVVGRTNFSPAGSFTIN